MRVPVSITWLFRTGSRLNFFDKSDTRRFSIPFAVISRWHISGGRGWIYPLTEVQLSLEAEREKKPAEYTPAGTTPDISTGLHLSKLQSILKAPPTDRQSFIRRTATRKPSYPDPATGLVLAESGVSVVPESEGLNLYYDSTAEKYAADEE